MEMRAKLILQKIASLRCMTALIHRNGGTWIQRGIPWTLLFEVKRHYIVIKPKCGSVVQIFCGNKTGIGL